MNVSFQYSMRTGSRILVYPYVGFVGIYVGIGMLDYRQLSSATLSEILIVQCEV